MKFQVCIEEKEEGEQLFLRLLSTKEGRLRGPRRARTRLVDKSACCVGLLGACVCVCFSAKRGLYWGGSPSYGKPLCLQKQE